MAFGGREKNLSASLSLGLIVVIYLIGFFNVALFKLVIYLIGFSMSHCSRLVIYFIDFGQITRGMLPPLPRHLTFI